MEFRYKKKAVIEFLTPEMCTLEEIFTAFKKINDNQVFDIRTVKVLGS